MNYSYKEILKRMKDKYAQLSGNEAEDHGDTDIRIRLLAGEIFALSSYADWLKRQMFYTTATGEQLDMHARQLGLTRNKGERAVGSAMISLNVPVEYDVTIPAGTVLSTSDGSLRYLVESDRTIQRGGSVVFADIIAENSGKKYNIPLRLVTTVVTHFSVAVNVSGSSSLTGGTDDETDEELRERIAYKLGHIASGANLEYYRRIAEADEGVCSASVSMHSSTITVVIAGRGAICSEGTLPRVQNVMGQKKAAGLSVNVINAVLEACNVSVSVTAAQGWSFASVQQNVQEAISEYFLSLRVGQPLILTKLGGAIISAPGVENYSFVNMTNHSGALSKLLTAGTVTVTEAGA